MYILGGNYFLKTTFCTKWKKVQSMDSFPAIFVLFICVHNFPNYFFVQTEIWSTNLVQNINDLHVSLVMVKISTYYLSFLCIINNHHKKRKKNWNSSWVKNRNLLQWTQRPPLIMGLLILFCLDKTLKLKGVFALWQWPELDIKHSTTIIFLLHRLDMKQNQMSWT